MKSQKRFFSGGHSYEELRKDTLIWRHGTKVGFAVILAPFAALTLMTLSHEHAEIGLPYQKIRNKPFPWKECPSCDLLDFECWAKCRADKK